MQKVSFLTIVLCLLTTVGISAQESQPEMADIMRTDGKIYVVVLVLATIFAGIIAYLVRIERKINKIEKNK